jgi:hypothetical protein
MPNVENTLDRPFCQGCLARLLRYPDTKPMRQATMDDQEGIPRRWRALTETFHRAGALLIAVRICICMSLVRTPAKHIVDLSKYVYIYELVYVRVCVCVYIYIYIYMCMHIYINMCV